MHAGRRFQQLQWKLTFSYTLVTVGALLLVELLLLGGGALLFDWLVVRSGPKSSCWRATAALWACRSVPRSRWRRRSMRPLAPR